MGGWKEKRGTFPEPRKPVITVAGTRLSRASAAPAAAAASSRVGSGAETMPLPLPLPHKLRQRKLLGAWDSRETKEWRALAQWKARAPPPQSPAEWERQGDWTSWQNALAEFLRLMTLLTILISCSKFGEENHYATEWHSLYNQGFILFYFILCFKPLTLTILFRLYYFHVLFLYLFVCLFIYFVFCPTRIFLFPFFFWVGGGGIC